MNAITKERDEYKIALECLLESIQEKFEDDDEGQKKSSILSRAAERSREKRVAVTHICSLFGIARSTFYRKARGPGRRESEDSALRTRIEAIQEKHDNCYGINRVTAALRRDGHDRKPGHNQVARVMATNDLNAVTRLPKNYRVCMKKGVAKLDPP